MFRPLFHLSVVVINCYTTYYDSQYVELPLPAQGMKDLPLNARSMYLTAWCLILQTLYFFVAFLNDIVGTNAQTTNGPVIRKIKDTIFPIAYNIAMFVSLAFWGLYIINKDWIVTEEIERVIPPIINHFSHTTVSIFMLIEMLLPYKTYPPRVLGYSLLLSFVIIYTIWFFIIFARFGIGIYPLFNYLNWPQRIMFSATSIAITPLLYNISEKFNDYVSSNCKNKYI